MKLRKLLLALIFLGITAGISSQVARAEESEDYVPEIQTEAWDGYDTTTISTGEVFEVEVEALHEGENSALVSGSSGYVSITEKEAYDAIWAMADEYPEGRPWTNDDMYWSYNLGGGGGCHGFALIVSDTVFGQNEAHRYTDYSQLRVGDVLRVNNNTHTVVVLENHLDEGYIIVTEGNYNSSIHWGRRISTRSLDAGFVYGYTRYVNDNRELVEAFVSRMYEVALGRPAEKDGLKDWTDRLVFHETDGAGIANGFIMSEELASKNLSNETYVRILYQTFLNREADAAGMEGWIKSLEDGHSRYYVLCGFVNSKEFDGICSDYGILRGTLEPPREVIVSENIYQFVERNYNLVLGRTGDPEGIQTWAELIASGEMTPEEVAKNFFFSDEYRDKEVSDSEYVCTLYRTFLGREPDDAGLNDWLKWIGEGMPREEVLEGFSRSDEFKEIMKGFGL